MKTREDEILKLFRGCRKPGRQVQIVAELTGETVEFVLEVLRRHGDIPADVDEHNYKKRLPAIYRRKLTEEERSYIIGSMEYPREIAGKMNIPVEQVLKVREKAEREACKNGKRNDH